jgi:hypothetical protein
LIAAIAALRRRSVMNDRARPQNQARPSGREQGDRRLLVVTRGGCEELQLRDGTLEIGRAFSCAIRLDGDDVSRCHATLTRRDDGGYTLRDLGSRNGVEVNGAKVDEHNLSPDDVIQIGAHLLLYEPAGSLDMEELVERASALFRMSREGTDAGLSGRSARDDLAPSNESWNAQELSELIDRSVAGFVDLDTDQPGATDAPIPIGRAIEPLHKAVYLLHETGGAFWEQDEWGGICKEAARVALKVLGGDKALIMLRRPDEDDLEVGALVTRGEVTSSLITPSVMRLMLEEERVLVSGRAQEDEAFAEDRELLEDGGIESMLGVPLIIAGDCIGFFYIDSKKGHHRYTPADARLFFCLAEHVCMHLVRLL